MRTIVTVLLTIAYFAALLPAIDRITLDDGTTVDCRIIRQSDNDIVYQKDGKNVTVKKTSVAEIVLDFGVDKYYLAANSAKTLEERTNYLVRSVEHFSNADYNRIALARIYIGQQRLDAAEELLKDRKNPVSITLMASIDIRNGRFAEAEQRLANVNPGTLSDSVASLYALVKCSCFAQRGDNEGVLAALEKAKQKYPNGYQSQFTWLFPSEKLETYKEKVVERVEKKRRYEAALAKTAEAAIVTNEAPKPPVKKAPQWCAGIETLNGYLGSVYGQYFFGPVGVGAGAGLDYSSGSSADGFAGYVRGHTAAILRRPESTNIPAANAVLLHLDVQSMSGIMIFANLQLAVRAKIGINLLWHGTSFSQCIEASPEILAGVYGFYLVQSWSFVFTNPLTVVPQAGIGYRFTF